MKVGDHVKVIWPEPAGPVEYYGEVVDAAGRYIEIELDMPDWKETYLYANREDGWNQIKDNGESIRLVQIFPYQPQEA